ncbi:MAG: alpha/beta hydrolase [Hoeflea sp.]|uniref:alpha/beta fold hydrolase n=1 Tax=Hoeflea sp. TaxID=1940281 RepID=UPI001D6C1B84|nr:alpha/beta hydrolase [Hoeflea sp.]MBU4528434.1 alpha/beta hydrolase [Alphaproteobacteria bacterium]MBU4543103.1 alpha/beta hydrolase [Alphaproteobacteria bacterium]MBU4551794.1 alpha/beta hydrolase [Alphaproteobacteria bacterium]MBV1723689.1 alpha/beta hydrolase [Hoeflea sp.]MBV1762005.1 alpha/beta hydrolase [Hoeflea sp.]
MFEAGKIVTAGDAALFVSQAGRADGPAIVLLHGGMGSRMDFVPLANHLANDYRLIAIDSRGHGRSTLGHANMSYRQLTEDTAAVLDQLGLSEAGIIGHSDGGIVALRLAASGLVRPRFVVAVAVHWQLPDDDPTREIYQGVSVEEWREMFGQQVERYEAENPEPDLPRLFAATKAMWLGRGADAYPGETVGAISSPLLVIHGDEDFLVSRKQAFELVERIEGARLLNLPFASHTVLEDSPADVLPFVASFIAGVQEEVPATGL